MATPLARTGRSMKHLEITSASSPRAVDAAAIDVGGPHLLIDLLAGDRAQRPADDHAVVGLEAAFDHAQIADQRPDLDLAMLVDDVLVEHQQVTSGLIGAE